MNCREFVARWDDLLDARAEGAPALEAALEAHASNCGRCRAVSVRYQGLHQAVAHLRPPVPSPASIERLYALTVPSSSPILPIVRHWGSPLRLGPLAVAASVFGLAWLGGGGPATREPAVRPAADFRAATVPDRALGLALAEATEATIGLAREASAPASRIGREVLDLGKSTTSGGGAGRSRALDSELAASGLFKAVGDRVEAGVGPISGSARYAFSFLLGPPDDSRPADAKRQDNF